MRRLLMSVCALALGGCSYPEFGFTTDGGPSVGDDAADTGIVGDDTSLEDAPVDDTLVDDTSMVDTSVVDSSSADTGTGVDTGTAKDTAVVDTAMEAEAGMPVGCAGRTELFCVDWDTATSPEQPFNNNKSIVPPGAIGMETTNPISSPNRFVASVGPGSVNTIEANVYKTFTSPAVGTAIRADMWIQVESATFPTASSSGSVFLFKLERQGGPGDGVTLSMDNTGFFVDRIAVDYEKFAVAYTITPNKWMHVRMDAVIRTAGGAVKLWIDDMTNAVLDKAGISTATADTTARLFSLGLYAEKPSGVFKARYDDVTFTFK